MCRLYAFRSNAPRKVECELIRAQNSLVAQSWQDEDGVPNADGWGLGTYMQSFPHVERQAEPAHSSDTFRWAAAGAHSDAVMAHIRRATVGMNLLENTHPFTYERFMFAHNGTIPSFDRVRNPLLAAMPEKHRKAIRGQTDSEHLFHLILSQYDARPDAGLLEALRSGIETVLDCLARTSDTLAIPGINLLLMDGRTLVGSRLARSLWYTERDHVHACEVCGGLLHVLDEPGPDYRAVVVASEQITVTEQWRAVPDGSAFQLEDGRLEFVSL